MAIVKKVEKKKKNAGKDVDKMNQNTMLVGMQINIAITKKSMKPPLKNWIDWLYNLALPLLGTYITQRNKLSL